MALMATRRLTGARAAHPLSLSTVRLPHFFLLPLLSPRDPSSPLPPLRSYETDFALATKKGVTLGPVQSNGRTFGPEQGAPTQIKRDSYYVEFGVVTHDWLLPKKAEKNLKEWQGISPAKAKGKDLKKDYQPDFANKGLRENLTKIKEANVRTPLPAPQVPVDDFMLQFSKDAGEICHDSQTKYDSHSPDKKFYLAADTAGTLGQTSPEKLAAETPTKSPPTGAPAAEEPVAEVAEAPTALSPGGESYLHSLVPTISFYTPSKKSPEKAEVVA
jgi:hypothetical protein